MGYHEFTIEGRNAVMEAFRSGKCIDKLFVLDGCQDGPVLSIKREAKKQDTVIRYVNKERLDQMSETGKHQGVIAYAAAYEYAEVEDILQAAREKIITRLKSRANNLLMFIFIVVIMRAILFYNVRIIFFWHNNIFNIFNSEIFKNRLVENAVIVNVIVRKTEGSYFI